LVPERAAKIRQKALIKRGVTERKKIKKNVVSEDAN